MASQVLGTRKRRNNAAGGGGKRNTIAGIISRLDMALERLESLERATTAGTVASNTVGAGSITRIFSVHSRRRHYNKQHGGLRHHNSRRGQKGVSQSSQPPAASQQAPQAMPPSSQQAGSSSSRHGAPTTDRRSPPQFGAPVIMNIHNFGGTAEESLSGYIPGSSQRQAGPVNPPFDRPL